MNNTTFSTLPQEIRDKIFSYLLDGAQVRDSSDPQNVTFAFDTALLLVNKRIRAQAAKHFHIVNDFVLITWPLVPRRPDLRNLEADLERAFLPVISHNKSAQAFFKPSVSINLYFGNEPSQDDSETRSIIISSDGLPTFCRDILQKTYHRLPGGHIYVVPGQDGLITVFHSENYVASFSMNIGIAEPSRENLNSKEMKSHQRRLLAPFTSITGHMQKLEIVGVDPEIASALISDMTPQIVWLDAVGWDLVRFVQEDKARLDAKMEQHETGLCIAYRHLAQFAICSPLLKPFLRSGEIVRDVTPLAVRGLRLLTSTDLTRSWQVGLLTLAMDCAITVATHEIATRQSTISTGVLMTETLKDVPEIAEYLQPRLLATIHHYCAIAECENAVLWGWPVHDEYQLALENLDAAIRLCPGDGVLHQDRDWVANRLTMPLVRCEALPTMLATLPARSHKTALDLVVPSGFRGWVSEANALSPELARRIEEAWVMALGAGGASNNAAARLPVPAVVAAPLPPPLTTPAPRPSLARGLKAASQAVLGMVKAACGRVRRAFKH